ncbi:MAG: hypothetical protein HC825_02260 [Oscillatoriales cyanobacterium RM1_1_9]|nr:hypothetical protein [Oscillatoriales cyanobacterium SM2_3_0]NJO44794.1 hypothetical protein [Oscillatoriales cyanobacterium RM2_1_1]NJO70831.1 hypothetical protein [Oscillatoriales cyanobacterium RM1_1_9]
MAILAILTITAPAIGTSKVLAHHGWSEYNDQQTLSLTGTIRRIGYDNPHVVIDLETSDKTWRAVLAPPSRMQSRGLSQNDLKVGQTVRLVGYVNRSDSQEIRAERIIIGQKTVELR